MPGSADTKLSVSVALATCNGARYLDRQLASIAAQTRKPDEIVIGDDRSSDESLALIQRFRAKHDLVVHWEQNRERLGSTRNFECIIGRCCGDIVVFCDQDDVWMPERLARTAATFAADPGLDYVFSDGTLIDEHGRRLAGSLFALVGFDALERRRFREDGALEVLLRHNVVTGATLAARREAIVRMLPFLPDWIHDYYIALALEVLGRGVFLEQPLIEYRLHAAQQIGGAGPSVRAALAMARLQSAAYCRTEARNFEALRSRMLELGLPREAPIVSAMREKARFLNVRAQMRERPMRLPALLWRGVRSGGYGRYAIGYTQAVVDVLAVGLAVTESESALTSWLL